MGPIFDILEVYDATSRFFSPLCRVLRSTFFGFYRIQEFRQWVAQSPHPLLLNGLIELMYKIDCKISSEYLPMVGLKEKYSGPVNLSAMPPITLDDLNWPPLRPHRWRELQAPSSSWPLDSYPAIVLEQQSLKTKASDMRQRLESKRVSLLRRLEKLKETKGSKDGRIETKDPRKNSWGKEPVCLS